MEHMIDDVPEEYLGAVTQLMAARKAAWRTWRIPRARLGPYGFAVPARGLIGFRTVLTETRGAGGLLLD